LLLYESGERIVNADFGRRLLAEFVGTALLVIFGAGAVVAALEVGHGQLDYAGLGIIALSFALVIAAVIYMFGTPRARTSTRRSRSRWR
jgi:glycerol uptake facilitator-like aquaporin